MAINPSTKYTGQIDTSDPAGYPYGKAQNVVTAGDGTGTPLEKDWVNDFFGMVQALLSRANITPSTTPEKVGASDISDALDALYAQTDFPDDNDTYTLLFKTDRTTTSGVISIYFSDVGVTIARDAEYQQGTGWVSTGAGNAGIITLNPSSNTPLITADYGTISGGVFQQTASTNLGYDYDVTRARAIGIARTGVTPSALYNHYGVASVGIQSATSVKVNLDDTFTSTDKMVISATCENPNYWVTAAANGQTDSFIFYLTDDAGTAQTITGAGAITVDVHFQVFGDIT